MLTSIQFPGHVQTVCARSFSISKRDGLGDEAIGKLHPNGESLMIKLMLLKPKYYCFGSF